MILNFSIQAATSGPRGSTVIVCHCAAVTDCTIRQLIEAGASTVDDITALCGAGACCEPCREEIGALLYSVRKPTHTPAEL